jgi:hypothetical protein
MRDDACAEFVGGAFEAEADVRAVYDLTYVLMELSGN